MAVMDSTIRSASEGPPMRALSAAAFKPRFVGGAADGSFAVVDEFSTDHLRSSFMPGSMIAVCAVFLVDIYVCGELKVLFCD